MLVCGSVFRGGSSIRDVFRRNLSLSNNCLAKMTVVGASSPSGQCLSLLLKQNPYVTGLKLYDDEVPLEGIAMDLSHINTKSKVRSYTGFENFKNAVSDTDVLIINNIEPLTTGDSEVDHMRNVDSHIERMVIEMHHVEKVPIVFVMSDPVDVVTAIFRKRMRMEDFLDPKKLIGMAYHHIIGNKEHARIHKMVPEAQNLLAYGGSGKNSIYFMEDRIFSEKDVFWCEDFLEKTEETTQQKLEYLKDKKIDMLKAYAAHSFLSNLAESFLRKRMVVDNAYVFNEKIYAYYPCVLGKEGVEQLILEKDCETRKFFDKYEAHIERMEPFDVHTHMLTSVPINREGDV